MIRLVPLLLVVCASYPVSLSRITAGMSYLVRLGRRLVSPLLAGDLTNYLTYVDALMRTTRIGLSGCDSWRWTCCV